MFTILLIALSTSNISNVPAQHILYFEDIKICEESIVDRYYINGQYFKISETNCIKSS